MGCGLDIVYPRPNRDLFERLPQNGALISEFPLGSEPEPGHFPVRNRIISGMSLAVVVVEAAEKSGALITARLALEQNRDVMAVPGRAGSMKSRGAHVLLKEGARLVETGQDILDEIRPQLEPRPLAKPRSAAPRPELTSEAKEVWEALGEETIHIDQLGRKVGVGITGRPELFIDVHAHRPWWGVSEFILIPAGPVHGNRRGAGRIDTDPHDVFRAESGLFLRRGKRAPDRLVEPFEVVGRVLTCQIRVLRVQQDPLVPALVVADVGSDFRAVRHVDDQRAYAVRAVVDADCESLRSRLGHLVGSPGGLGRDSAEPLTLGGFRVPGVGGFDKRPW